MKNGKKEREEEKDGRKGIDATSQHAYEYTKQAILKMVCVPAYTVLNHLKMP